MINSFLLMPAGAALIAPNRFSEQRTGATPFLEIWGQAEKRLTLYRS